MGKFLSDFTPGIANVQCRFVKYHFLGEPIHEGWMFQRTLGKYHGCFSILILSIGDGEPS